MNKVTHDTSFQGPPAPVPPSAAYAHTGMQTEPGTRAQTRSQGQIMTTAPSDDTPNATGPADTVDTVDTAARDSRNGGATRETEDQATHTSQPAEPSSQPSLGPADLRLLNQLLHGGDRPLAERADLVELHKRILTMFTTLNEGLGETQDRKAAQDRAALGARIDDLEAAVNRMEGALRIEMEPVLRDSFARVIAETARPQRSWWDRLGRAGALALLLGVGLTLGALYHGELHSSASALLQQIQTSLQGTGS
ncbi:hypothetical protein [Phaeobacter italicus]|uniref:hypothetical protein n=1 Tax=Phaeobacter italicus TaxID=481446 RepID=UPI00248D5BA2|nr:hypothetical protein [Phaeobacter italicus]